MMDTQKIIDRLDGIYGKGRGIEVYRNIMPGILADFEKMVKTSEVGKRITEQYRVPRTAGLCLPSPEQGMVMRLSICP